MKFLNVAYGIRTNNAELKNITVQYSSVLPTEQAADSKLNIIAVYIKVPRAFPY